MKKNKKGLIAFLAILTAVVGIAFAIGAYLKRKAESISEDLDFDADFYDDDEFFENGSDEPNENDDIVVDDVATIGVVEDDSDEEDDELATS